MKTRKVIMPFVLGVTGVLAGCSSVGEQHLDLSRGGQPGVIDASTHAYTGKDANGVSGMNGNKSANSSLSTNDNQANANNLETSSLSHTIYFLYDSSDVEPSFIPLIEKQSQVLLSDSDAALVLEGHADERGSREYNIALGEERAKAVAKIMQAHGVHANQLEIVSYGEEKPASFEHTETAWHLNRRVNLISQRNQ